VTRERHINSEDDQPCSVSTPPLAAAGDFTPGMRLESGADIPIVWF